jgi:hypothetical protein
MNGVDCSNHLLVAVQHQHAILRDERPMQTNLVSFPFHTRIHGL